MSILLPVSLTDPVQLQAIETHLSFTKQDHPLRISYSEMEKSMDGSLSTELNRARITLRYLFCSTAG
jgi:hypothetical protein